MAERRRRRAIRPWRCARTSPAGPCRRRSSAAAPAGKSAELAVGRSGLGDGLVAFRQGPFGNAAIVAAQATAPPAELILSAPKSWVKPSQALIAWQPASSADGPLRYRVVLDGRALARARGRLAAAPGSARAGLRAPSRAAARDRHQRSGHALRAVLAAHRRSAAGGQDRASEGRLCASACASATPIQGLSTHAVSVSFGDGHSARGRKRFLHRYARAGIYQIVVHVRDQARQRRRRAPAGERAMRRLLDATAVLSLRLLACLPRPRPAGGATCSGRSRSSRRARFRQAHEPQQADYAHDPAISGNGRYVAFDGSFGGLTGVWRRDLQTGAVHRSPSKTQAIRPSARPTPSCPRSAQTGAT